jgi:hypothetical protein
MESSTTTNARRTEDIALDLLKFVAAHANLGRTAGGAAGFVASSTAKPEDQVAQVFELYARCREAVESPTPSAKK